MNKSDVNDYQLIRSDGVFTLKNMTSSEQIDCSLEELVNKLNL